MPGKVAAALRAACLLGWVAGAGACSSEEPPRRERVFDFIAHLEQAAVRAGEPYRPERKVWGDRFVNTDDADLHALVLPEMELEFRDVPVHEGAALHYAFGPNKVLLEPARGAVEFTIEASAPGDAVARVQETLDPAGPDFRIQRGVLDLSALAGCRARFVFRTRSPAGEASAWPAWTELRLLSRGRPEQPADCSLRVFEICAELLAQEEGAPVLPAEPPHEYRTTLQVPAHAALAVDALFDAGEAASAAPGAASVAPEDASVALDFLVELDGVVVFQEGMSPGRAPRVHAQIDLSRHAGRSVEAVFRTARVAGAGPWPEGVRCAWVLPRLLTSREIPRAGRRPGEWNVLFLVVDTLRADRLGAYGCERDTSPNFDRLAAESLLFRNMFSQSSWTLPSTASLFTGLSPPSHGVVSERRTYLDDRFVTLAEELRDAGLTTGAFVSNLLITAQSNFQQGFETFQSLSWANSKKVQARFLDWLDNQDGRRFFAYLHCVDPHDPYEAPAPWTEFFRTEGNPYSGMSEKATMEEVARRTGGKIDADAPEVRDAVQHLRDLYDSEVHYWDLCLGALLDALRERGLLEQTVLVITADHGEEFYEHGMFQHGQQLYQETVHVPLLLRVPGAAAAVVDEPVQSVDLKPTLLSLLGIGRGADTDWGEVLPRHGVPRALFLSTETGVEKDVAGTLVKNAVVFEGFKLVSVPALGRTHLYDLGKDPGEHQDLGAQEAERTASLLRRIDAWLEEARRPDHSLESVDPETYQRMKEIGYLER